MTKLEDFITSTQFLSKEHGLYKPKLDSTVAGIIPEILKNMNKEYIIPKGLAQNNNVDRHLKEAFPSGIENVVLIIADGVGAQHLSKLGGTLAENIESKGTVASTMFPSMTSTVMSSISLGRYPSDHGVLGYNIYNENIDDIWNALAMKYNKNGIEREILEDLPLSDLINGNSLFNILQNESNPLIFPSQMERPSLIDLIASEVPLLKYDDIPTLIGSSLQMMNSGKNFTAIYYPYADKFGHSYGPESPQYAQAIKGLDTLLDSLLQTPLHKAGNTAIVVTSDHGQSQINHDISFWMNRDTWSKYKDEGILLSTSGRTIHAYCRDDTLDKGKMLLEKFANGRGIVINNKEAMSMTGIEYNDSGYSKRMGDFVMILEDEYLYDIPERVLFEEETKQHGQHGSLSSKELFVPVGIL